MHYLEISNKILTISFPIIVANIAISMYVNIFFILFEVFTEQPGPTGLLPSG